MLRGIFEADLTARRVVVISDEVSKGAATERIAPVDFQYSFRAMDMTTRMLLEPHGGPQERWSPEQ